MTEYAQGGFDVPLYRQQRPRYPARLYELIDGYRDAGMRSLLLDVGCGPGQASWPLLTSFDRLLGFDPGQGMIEEARRAYAQLYSDAENGAAAEARYVVAAVEDVHQLELAPGSVDCIICGTAAHWFADMRQVYADFARYLRTGGTLALWTYDLAYPARHASTATMVSRFAYDDLAAYVDSKGSRRIRSLYAELDAPSEDDEHWTEVRHIAYPNSGASNGYIPILPLHHDTTHSTPVPPTPPCNKNGTITEWDWTLHTRSQTTWTDLTNAKRTNSSFYNWQKQHPDVAPEHDIAAQQVNALREAVQLDQQANGRHVDDDVNVSDDEMIDVMRPMGLLLMRRR